MAGAFAGRVAVVTGASRGIGFAIAEALVAGGAAVAVTARKPDPLVDAVDRLRVVAGADDRVVGVPGRAADAEHRALTVERTLQAFGRIDHLVNNAGTNPVYGPLLDIDLDTARAVLDTNALAALAWVQLAHRAWMGENGGSIVNVASVAGLRPAQGLGLYGASKAVLTHLTAQLAVELGPAVRVNAVAPAIVRTRFAAALYEGKEAAVAAGYPLRRIGRPQDVASAVTWLLSDEASWVTGQTLVLDGGVTLTGGL